MRRLLLAAVLAAGAVLSTAAFGATKGVKGSAAPQAASRADTALITCGNTRTIGLAAPITGLAASLGTQQRDWARFYVKQHNAKHKAKFKLVEGDTQLPDQAQAVAVAERLGSNDSVLGVVGPAGSQEVQVSTAPLRAGGLGFVSPSATRTTLTDGSRKGYFFRVVPNDDQQGPRVANYIRKTLKKRIVYIIDDEESYSTGLADKVGSVLKNAGLSVGRDHVSQNLSDFSSVIARIPSNTQVVYVPWQLAPKAQLFGQQLRAAGKTARLFGSDGLFDPDTFKIPGSLVSFFPIDLTDPVIKAYRAGPGGGESQLFGLPSYAATQVLARAIDKSCANGNATRAEVRRNVASTVILKKDSLLGFEQRFVQQGTFPLGPGDMQRPADFGIYQISTTGQYVRVA